MDARVMKSRARIREAKGWKRGTKKLPLEHSIWESSRCKVFLRKPGKEAFWKAPKQRNRHDMSPDIVFTFRKNEIRPKPASFTKIFGELFKVRKSNGSHARLLGALLVRSAFMADHIKTRAGWRYRPHLPSVRAIAKDIPRLYGVPLEGFLHYLDALAWNEDVKYSNRKKQNGGRYDIAKGPGRYNNLMTCAYIIAADLGKVSYAGLLGGLIRTRVAPLDIVVAFKAFPDLGNYEPKMRRK
jgi:hypothetical protein